MTDSGSVKCAACGAFLELVSGFRVTRCPACNKANLILDESGYHRYRIEKTISSTEAVNIACDTLVTRTQVDKSYLLKMQDKAEISLYYVPNYCADGLVALRSTVKKYRESIRSRFSDGEGGGGRLIGVSSKIIPESVHYDTRIIVQGFNYHSPAITGLNWGLETHQIPDDATVLFADLGMMNQEATVLTPTISWDLFEKQHELMGTRNVETTRDKIIQDNQVIYYPVWRITTRYKGLVYDSFVCAATGVHLKSSCPQSLKSRATAFSISYAFTSFCASCCIILMTRLIQYAKIDTDMVMNSLDVLLFFLSIPMLSLVALMAAVAAYGWDKFRYNPEIVVTRDTVSVYSSGKQGKTFLDRISQATLENVSGQLESVFKQ